MKNKIKIIERRIIILLIISIILIQINFVSATNIGISPSKIHFKDVLRGGYAERTTTITIDSTEETKVEIQPRGEITEWLDFSDIEFRVSKDNPYYLIISVTPPNDIPNGNYTGFLRVKTSKLSSDNMQDHATSAVMAVLDLFLEVEITDNEYSQCKAKTFHVKDAEEGEDIIFTSTILNAGNIRLNPTIKIDIWDKDQNKIIKTEEFNGKQVKPTTEELIEISVDSSSLDIGQYWVDIAAVDCYDKQTLTFDILEEGSLKASGKLVQIVSNPWSKQGETTLIEAFFENNGQKTVNAFFKGKITNNGKIVQLIESEKTNVPIGELNIFEFYFTPKDAGKYIINGRVFYDNKKTYEKSAVINITPNGFSFTKLIKNLIYILLLAGIIYLIYKIRKEKKIYKKKLRGIHR